MREIKFRAWQKNYEKMGNVDMIEFDKGEIKLIRFDNGEKCAPRFNTYGLKDWPLDCLELMQYTGLKDKNGVEIYEGDVFNIGNENHEVKYSIESAAYQVGGLLLSITAEHREVIGNIYQNPELLK